MCEGRERVCKGECVKEGKGVRGVCEGRERVCEGSV